MKPWWMSDDYSMVAAVPVDFAQRAGPKGVAVVRAWPNGKTDAGWGEDKFMSHYNRNLFDKSRKLPGYDAEQHAIAYVMRSINVVCIDIDGKNGGFDGVKELGPLPKTMAETSKSGNGYHLFYKTELEWDEQSGFDGIKDRIGVAPGVDLRGTGCVYHYPSQRWNYRPLVKFPDYLADRLKRREQQVTARVDVIKKIRATGEIEEVLVMQNDLKMELEKPIPAGRRNNTLFAIGSQMFIAGVPDWAEALSARAEQVGLDQDEIDKLVGNVQKYGAKAVSTP